MRRKKIYSRCRERFLPVYLSTVKNLSPSSTLYTTLALLPYVGSSASDAVTFITDVPVEKRQHWQMSKQRITTSEPGGHWESFSEVLEFTLVDTLYGRTDVCVRQ